jgi:hypothetical protein
MLLNGRNLRDLADNATTAPYMMTQVGDPVEAGSVAARALVLTHR